MYGGLGMDFFTPKTLMLVILGALALFNVYLLCKISDLEVEVKYLDKVSELALKQRTEEYSDSDREVAELLMSYYNQHVK